ncbi:alpha/beta hydrolase [Penicillium atrosanguineum]|uniref:Alpha/beta hydrolase n=1 Tax=Penicillium atrosanguineum TaxID=1132637 RepID=A0A9W9PRN8_9EURO|nr:alpha/beta hydrolase [Penicillium atrosanguineum]
MVEAVDKIKIEDPRVQRRSATIHGKTYGITKLPSDLEIHGFPDLSLGWRYQIPLLLRLGFRVVCPDCIGYGRSDSPTDSILPYTMKSHCEDFHQLAKQLGCENIILGGHDWGAVYAFCFALYFPSFVSHLLIFVVPYPPPVSKYIAVNDLVKFRPSFGYMLQFGSEDGVIESHTRHRQGIRQFLNSLFGGRTQDGRKAIEAKTGIDFELLPGLSETRLLDSEEMEYYVDEYARNGLRGPCNTYRTGYQNFVDELSFLDDEDGTAVKCPTLFLRATEDFAIPASMVEAMAPYVKELTIEDVRSSHWIMLERPQKVNEVLEAWFQQQGLVE